MEDAKKKKKDPFAPRKPPGVFFFFQGTKLNELAKSQPGVPLGGLMKQVNKLWKKMTAPARAPFVRANEAAVSSFQRQSAAYEAAGGGKEGAAAAKKAGGGAGAANSSDDDDSDDSDDSDDDDSDDDTDSDDEDVQYYDTTEMEDVQHDKTEAATAQEVAAEQYKTSDKLCGGGGGGGTTEGARKTAATAWLRERLSLLAERKQLATELEMKKRLANPLHFELTPNLMARIMKDSDLLQQYGLVGMGVEAAKAELDMKKRLARPFRYTLTPQFMQRLMQNSDLVQTHGLVDDQGKALDAALALAKMQLLQLKYGGWSAPPEPELPYFQKFELRITKEWLAFSSINSAGTVAAAWYKRRGAGNIVACERYFHFDMDVSEKSFRCIALSQMYKHSEACQAFERESLALFNSALEEYVRLIEQGGEKFVCIFVAAKCLEVARIGEWCAIGNRSRVVRVGHPSWHRDCESYDAMLFKAVLAIGLPENADIAFFGLAQTKTRDGFTVSVCVRLRNPSSFSLLTLDLLACLCACLLVCFLFATDT